FLFQVGSLIDIDGFDRVALPRQLRHGRAHLAAGSAPLGVEVEEDRLGGCGARWYCGDQGDQKGGDTHAARTPFPRDKPRVDAVAPNPCGTSLASCTSIRGGEHKAAGPRFARCVAGSSPGSRAQIGLAKPGADGPPSDERTPEPKEADVWRDGVRYAGNEARPFLGRSASRQGPHDPPSWRAASRRASRPRA